MSSQTGYPNGVIGHSLKELSRRSLIFRLGALTAAFTATVRRSFAQKRLAISLDKAEHLKTVGGSALLKVQEKEILFIREAEDKIRVVNPVCTHQKCTVAFSAEKKRILCSCHGSNFDLDGKVLNGPAQKPLQLYDASLDVEKARIIFTVE